MTSKYVLTLLALAISLTGSPSLSHAAQGGSNGGGGGDMESEFKAVAQNILDWITAGRSRALKLPSGMSHVDYQKKMQQELQSYSIEMVSRELKYGGAVKTCVSRQNPQAVTAKSTEAKGAAASADKSTTSTVRNQIICNQALFRDTYLSNTEGVYRLIHHEFAGVAGVETNQGQESDYKVSDQLSKHLEEQTVLRLPVDAMEPDPVGLRTFLCGKNQLVQTHRAEAAEESIGYGSFPSEASARDYVVWLLSKKDSFLSKALKAKFIDEADPFFNIEGVGRPISIAGGGRVGDYSTTFLVPIEASGKRWNSTIAFVRVVSDYQQTFNREESLIPMAPGATEISHLMITSIYDPEKPTEKVDFKIAYGWGEMTSKVCRDVKIPKAQRSLVE